MAKMSTDINHRCYLSFYQRKHTVLVTRCWLMLLLSTLVLLVSCQKNTSPDPSTVLEPGSPALISLYQEGRAAYQAEHFDKAAVVFERVVEIDPQHLNALINWGVALSSNNLAEEALPKFQQALAREPNHPGALYNSGVAYQRLGLHTKAIEQYDRSISLNPSLLTPALNRYLTRQRAKVQDTHIGASSSR